MELNQKIETRDPLLVLHAETGQFHVTGPAGQKELWQCRAGGSVTSVRFIGRVTPPRSETYIIEKIASEVSEAERSQAAGAGD